MQQSISFITLGVKDLEKMKQFYQKDFGWTPIKDSAKIVFFQLNGIILGLFPEDELAKDAGIKNDGHGFKRFTLAINVANEQKVDQLFSEFKQKKVKIIKPPEKVFWGGYSGYIADIENNLWEIVYNPFIQLDDYGNVIKMKPE